LSAIKFKKAEKSLVSWVDSIVPLTQKVRFQVVLEKCGEVQIPKLIRWQFKLETDQVLRVGVKPLESMERLEFYYAKMTKDGRLRVPRRVQSIFKSEKPSLSGSMLDVTLEPA